MREKDVLDAGRRPGAGLFGHRGGRGHARSGTALIGRAKKNRGDREVTPTSRLIDYAITKPFNIAQRHSAGRYLAARLPPVQVQVSPVAGGVPAIRTGAGVNTIVLSASTFVP